MNLCALYRQVPFMQGVHYREVPFMQGVHYREVPLAQGAFIQHVLYTPSLQLFVVRMQTVWLSWR